MRVSKESDLDGSELERERLRGLRTDIKRWAKKTKNLTEKTLRELEVKSTNRRNQIKELHRLRNRVEQEIEKLAAMELRLVIAAPMSAGKSTIIDAIVSREVLPRRNTAMTVFPTEICLDPDAQRASLEFEPRFLKLLESYKKAIRSFEMEEGGREKLKGENPKLVDLIDKIREDPRRFNSKLVGATNIYSALQRVNDLARISFNFLIEKSLLRDFEPSLTPRVRVPLPSEMSAGTGNGGKLVIVDTPGPNEDRAGHLYDVLDRELELGTMVALVLDYTQLNSGASEKIKKRVDEFLKVVPPENLFVIVNKIDQRKTSEDLSSDDVKKMITAKLGISINSIEKRLFEVAAERALTAAKGVRTLDGAWSGSDIDLNDSLITEIFRLRYPLEWEDELEDLGKEDTDDIRDELEKGTRRLWKKSGFERFITLGISEILKKTGHEILKSTCTSASNALDVIVDIITLQSRALREDKQKLIEELEALREKQEDLREVEKNIKDTSGRTLKIHIDGIEEFREYWREGIRRKVKDEFNRIRADKFKPDDRSILGQSLGKKTRGNGNKKIVEFSSKEEAERLGKQIVERANEVVGTWVEKLASTFESELPELYEKVEILCEKKIQPVLVEAQKRLNDEFNVNLSAHDFVFNSPDMGGLELEINLTKEQYSENKRKVRREGKWYILALLPFYEGDIYYENIRKEKTIYQLSLESLESQAVASIDPALDSVIEALKKHLEVDFQEAIESYVSAVNAVLERLEESLEAAIRDQKKSVEEKKELRKRLDDMSAEAGELRTKIRSHLNLIEREGIE